MESNAISPGAILVFGARSNSFARGVLPQPSGCKAKIEHLERSVDLLVHDLGSMEQSEGPGS